MYRKYNHKFLLVTYGDNSDFEVIKESEAIKLLPIYSVFNKYNSKLLRYASSFYMPKVEKTCRISRFNKTKSINGLLGSNNV